MTTKQSVRRRLVRGGAVTVAGVVLLVPVAGVPTRAPEQVLIAAFAVGGLALLFAGRYERLSLGVASVGWPRVAAVGLGLLAVGSSTVGFLQLLSGSTGLGSLQAVLALFVALLLAFGTLECWLGGVGLDEEAFAVE